MQNHLIESTLRTIYSVSKLNLEARSILELSFPPLWVEGEISNLRDPGAGHLYFTLKDAKAQIRCAMFRSRSNLLKFRPKNGMQILVRGKLSLYEERGDFQLIIEFMEESGDGLLQKAFIALKKRLGEEGLFDLSHKKSLPKFPQRLGIVTSPTGAAIRDILVVLRRRFIGLPVIIYPSAVQGSEAAAQIAAAIDLANQRQECDVLLVSRGGGSLEDLWPFNEEIVARAIFASQLPVITGIGHEIDFTIADFVADLRGPTPSAAAELISQSSQELQAKLAKLESQLLQSIKVKLRHAQLSLSHLQKRLPHPQRWIQNQAQRLDDLTVRLTLAQNHLLRHLAAALCQVTTKLQGHNPQQQLNLRKNQLQSLEQRMALCINHILARWQQRLTELMRALDGVSPLNTLKRGYAIVLKNQTVVESVAQIASGDSIEVKLSDGEIRAVVQ